jgi:hypothetical protein
MRSLKSVEKRAAPRYPLARMAKIQLGYDAPAAYCLILFAIKYRAKNNRAKHK